MSYKSGFYKGRLGIGLANSGGDGTGNPRFPLDVNGDIRLTGSLLRSDGTPYLGGGLINYIPKGIKSIVNNDGGYFVGFGTHTPTEALDISGNLKVSGQILSVDGDNFSTVVPIAQQQTTTENPTWHGDVTTTVSSSSDSATALNDKADIASPTFTGNVGIGTTSPNSKLHIKNDANITSGDTLLTGLSNGPAECLRLQGKKINNSSLGAGSLLRFTNTQDDSNNVEYNLGAIAGFDIDGDMGGALAFYTAKDSNTSGTITTPYDLASSNSVLNGQIYTTSDTYKPASNAFNGIIDRSVVDAWRTADVYNTSSYTGSTTTTYDTNQTANGEYIQVDIGQTIVLSTYKIRARNAGSTYGYEQAPKSGKLLYSTDGSTWNLLDTYGPVTTSVYYDGSNYLDSIVDVTSNSVRTGRYFRFVIESVNSTISNSRANILELTLLGLTQTQHDSNNIPSYTGDLEEKMIITHAGNVGIGTTSPGYKLEVNGSAKLGATTVSYLKNHLSSGTGIWFDYANTMRFITNDNEKMIIKSDGNVGIGTTSPGYKLEIKQGKIYLNNSNTWSDTEAANTKIYLGDTNFGVGSGHFTGDGDGEYTTLWSYNGAGRGIRFCSTALGTNKFSDYTTRMIIEGNTGNVGIGLTDPASPLEIQCTQGSSTDSSTQWNGAKGLRLARWYNHSSSNTNSSQYAWEIVSGWHNDLLFRNINSNGTVYRDNVLILDDNGNVGIGTTSPRCPLNTNKLFTNSDNTIPNYVGDIDGNNTCDLFLGKSKSSTNNYWGIWMGTVWNSSWGYPSYIQAGSTSYHYPLLLNPNGGNVGIGTTSCDARTLHIKNQHTNWTSSSNWNYYNAVSFPGGWTHFETVTGVSTNSNMAARAEGNFKFGTSWPKTRTGVVSTVTIGATGSNYYRKYTTLMRIGTTENYYFMFHVFADFVDGNGGYIGASLVVDGVDTWVFRKSSGGNEIKSRTEGYSWTAGDVHLLEFYIYFDGYCCYSKSGMGLLWTRDGYSPTNHNSQYTGRSSDNVNGVTGWDNDFNNAGGANLGYENEDINYTTKIEGDQCGGLIIESDGPSIYANNNIVCTEVTANRQGASSDDRLKHNEKIVTKGLNVINKLKLKTYFKGNVLKEKNFDYELDDEGKPITDELYNFEAGFIAQDVMNIPELKHCVIGEEYEKEVITKQKIITLDEPEIDEKGEKHFEKWIEYDDIEKTPQKLHLNYNDIFCYNVLATQELAAQQKLKNIEFENENTTLTIKITDQEDEISTLKTKNVDFKNKLTSLETENQELENKVATLQSELAAIKAHLGI